MELLAYPPSLPDGALASMIDLLRGKPINKPHTLHVAWHSTGFAFGKFVPDENDPVPIGALPGADGPALDPPPPPIVPAGLERPGPPGLRMLLTDPVPPAAPPGEFSAADWPPFASTCKVPDGPGHVSRFTVKRRFPAVRPELLAISSSPATFAGRR